MTEVDMLKNHIIQARVQASAKESQALERVLEEAGQASDQLGPPPGEMKPSAVIHITRTLDTLYCCTVACGMCAGGSHVCCEDETTI